MNENLYIAHKKLPHKTLRVHSVVGQRVGAGSWRVLDLI